MCSVKSKIWILVSAKAYAPMLSILSGMWIMPFRPEWVKEYLPIDLIVLGI